MFGPDEACSAAFCLLKASALALPMNLFFGAVEEAVVGTLCPSSVPVIVRIQNRKRNFAAICHRSGLKSQFINANAIQNLVSLRRPPVWQCCYEEVSKVIPGYSLYTLNERS